MANGIAIKDVTNKLQKLGGEEVIPISTGANDPEVVEVDTLKEYINEDISTALNNKQDTISDLSTIRSGAAAGATAYQKPGTGIPSTDLKSGVIPDVSGFVTNTVDDLVNYYTKVQTYSQTEVQQLINTVKQFTYELVSVLPAASASTMNKIYLVPSSDPQTQNIKDEYITINSSGSYSWEQIGSTAIDLSDYVTTTALNTALADYTTSTDLSTLLAGYQTKIDSTHKLDYSLIDNTPTIPDITNCVQKSETAGLIKNDGTVDTNTYLTSAHEVPSGGNSGQVLKKTSGSDYAYGWGNINETLPSAYCTTSGSTATKVANCSLWTATANTYLHILIGAANTYQGALMLKVNGNPTPSGAPIYINGAVSSSTNYTLPAGSYIIFYNGTNYYFRTDGKIPTATSVLAAVSDLPTVMGASGTNHASGLVPDPGSTQGTTKFLREDGSWQVPPSGGGGEVNTIESISVNTVAQTPDANKNVDITVPDVSGKEDSSNKVTSLSSSSTDTQYPSAKAVYDLVGDIETLLSEI